jgi:hypothetical protein
VLFTRGAGEEPDHYSSRREITMSATDDATKAPQASARMTAPDRLVGTWEVTGGAVGTVSYEWMSGGFFLLQRVDLTQNGRRIIGLEVIGHLYNPFADASPSEEIESRFYDNQGDTLDYVYELDGDTLTIWAGEKGSPAYMRGAFSDDGSSLSGQWFYPMAGATTPR